MSTKASCFRVVMSAAIAVGIMIAPFVHEVDGHPREAAARMEEVHIVAAMPIPFMFSEV